MAETISLSCRGDRCPVVGTVLWWLIPGRWSVRRSDDRRPDAAKGPEGEPVPLLRLDRNGGGRPDPVVSATIVGDRSRSVKQLIQISSIVKTDGTAASAGAGGGGGARVVLVGGRPPGHGPVQHLGPRSQARARAGEHPRRPGRGPVDGGRRDRGGPGLPGHG